MTPCPTCRRHLAAADSTCPFCGGTRSVLARAFNTVGGVVTAVVLAACYGSPPSDKIDDSGLDTSAIDADSDGFTTVDDCNDADDTVNLAPPKTARTRSTTIVTG